MYLLTGATGNIGRNLTDLLLAEGAAVRAVTRSPEKAGLPAAVDVVRADIGADPASLAGALDGVDTAFVNPAVLFGRDPSELVDVLAKGGVRRIVLVSSQSVLPEDEPAHGMIAEVHRAWEAAVKGAVPEWTMLRPGEFATNYVFQWGPQLRAGDVVRGPFAEAGIATIHEKDIADVAARALLTDDHIGAAYELSGPAAVTNTEKARLLGEALGRPIRYEEVPVEQARAAMVGAGVPESAVDALLGAFGAAVEHPQVPSPDVQRVTGRPGRTFAQWAADHTADFS
ncbi:hypothetical protein BIV57_21620 [Mangrovactinospora gilvigrisea]|uniref:NAD(P)-binding domain-containing protein n=1 Tax=Mangrovactinospora gilvigrisea TaxID=1428644 RepID=A0A1J7B9Z4_9ACTN|nr:NAD(P)H-binding protein [Mangrovactinospora gilvigrisea]OIV35430.1 hypothetical protein BIV57_21620 [Mangrovactinospora gilvigrisea]